MSLIDQGVSKSTIPAAGWTLWWWKGEISLLCSNITGTAWSLKKGKGNAKGVNCQPNIQIIFFAFKVNTWKQLLHGKKNTSVWSVKSKTRKDYYLEVKGRICWLWSKDRQVYTQRHTHTGSLGYNVCVSFISIKCCCLRWVFCWGEYFEMLHS